MYRIQAYNFVKDHTFIYTCSSSERAQFIQDLIDTGNYRLAGISCEWIARYD